MDCSHTTTELLDPKLEGCVICLLKENAELRRTYVERNGPANCGHPAALMARLCMCCGAIDPGTGWRRP